MAQATLISPALRNKAAQLTRICLLKRDLPVPKSPRLLWRKMRRELEQLVQPREWKWPWKHSNKWPVNNSGALWCQLGQAWCNLIFTTKHPLICYSLNKTLTTVVMKFQATPILLNFRSLIKVQKLKCTLFWAQRRKCLLTTALCKENQLTRASLKWTDQVWMASTKLVLQPHHSTTRRLRTKRSRSRYRKKRWRNNYREYLVIRVKASLDKVLSQAELNLE
jgi:hypothetical protein